MPTMSLGERIAARQLARQETEIGTTYWDPGDIKGLEDLLCNEEKGFKVMEDTAKALEADYKQNTTLLVLTRRVRVVRKTITQKVTLYANGTLRGELVDLATIIPNA